MGCYRTDNCERTIEITDESRYIEVKINTLAFRLKLIKNINIVILKSIEFKTTCIKIFEPLNGSFKDSYILLKTDLAL